jgi:hypothetical protein
MPAYLTWFDVFFVVPVLLLLHDSPEATIWMDSHVFQWPARCDDDITRDELRLWAVVQVCSVHDLWDLLCLPKCTRSVLFSRMICLCSGVQACSGSQLG